MLTLYRSAEAAARTLEEEKLEALSKSELVRWEWFSSKDSVTTAEYQDAMNLPERTARNHLKKLTELGLLEMVGAGRSTHYEVLRK